MIYNVEILEEVFYDVEAAILYYDLRVAGLGMRFYLKFQDAINAISVTPYLFQRTLKNYRQVKVKGFPFHIVYEVEEERIIVSRLFHAKRNPKSKFKK